MSRALIVCMMFSLLALTAATLNAQIRQSRTAQQPTEIDYSLPLEYEIGGIEVVGLENMDPNAFILLTGLRVGDRISVPGSEISDAVKKLWKHGLVDNVSIYQERIENGKIFLVVELTERPRLRKFVFSGVSKTQEKDIKDNISLYRGKVLTDAIIKNTQLTVQRYFVDKGYLNVAATIRQERDTVLQNNVILYVDVNKGSKVKVRDIIVDGNSAISDAKLKKKMKKTGETPKVTIFDDLIWQLIKTTPKKAARFVTASKEVSNNRFAEYMNQHVRLNIFKSTKYIKADFAEDKRSLVAYYNSKGYRDARVVSDSIYSVAPDRINIVLRIEEGNKYYFRNINWNGNYVYTDDLLGRALGIKSGDVYDRELLDKKLTFNPQGTDISGLYMDNGYLFFRIDPVEWVEGDSIDIEMRMFEGNPATVNKITINGNDRTNDHVIRRELRTVPGQKFSRQNIIRDNQQLAQMGYFDPEQIDVRPIPNPVEGTVDIEYNLVEQPSDQVELSGGWGGFYGFVGTLGLSFNNFSLRNIPKFNKWRPLPIGDGQKLSIRAQANGRSFQNYSLTFVEPWLGGRKPNSLSVSLNKSIQRDINPFTRETRGTLTLDAITVGIGKRLNWPDNYFTLSESLSYTIYGFENWTFNSLGFSDGQSRSLTLNTTIARTSVDNPMYPRTGSMVQLSVSLTPPYSIWNNVDYENGTNSEKFAFVEYHKWNFDMKHYLTLVGDLVLESRAHFGFIGSYTDKAGIGPFERFFLGGDGLAGGFNSWLLGTDVIGLRGYPNNDITPPNFGRSATPLTTGEIDGGTVFNKFSFELRYPITTGQAATIYALTYVEGGNNWNNFEQFDPFNLYRSAGFGARIFMPAFGLIGLNWAYGFDRLPGRTDVSGSQFHFTIGQQIR